MKFFKRKPDAPPRYEKDPLAFLLWDAGERIDIARQAIPDNAEKDRWELVARNCDTAFNGILERCAIEARRGNFQEAQGALRTSEAFFDGLQRAAANAKQEPLGFIHALNFTQGLLAGIISGEWEQTTALAAACRLEGVREEGGGKDTGGVPDEIAKMLAATVLDDGEGFASLRGRFVKDRNVDPFYVKFFPYPDLMDLVLKRDETALAEGLHNAQDNFQSRQREGSTGHDYLLAGCGENNTRVIDVWSTSVMALARHRGMHLAMDTVIIPAPDRFWASGR